VVSSGGEGNKCNKVWWRLCGVYKVGINVSSKKELLNRGFGGEMVEVRFQEIAFLYWLWD